MKQQTSITFLIETLASQGILFSSDIRKAKEMHNEEVKSAYVEGITKPMSCNRTKAAEKYYIDKYKIE